MEHTIRILIADDHAVFREGLRAVLGAEPDMEVVVDGHWISHQPPHYASPTHSGIFSAKVKLTAVP